MTFHKTTMLAATSAIALMTAATCVQAADEKPMTPTVKDSTSQPAPVKADSQIKADTLVGKNIKNTSGDKIGDIESVIIGKDGTVAAVIVGVGGFLGMGEHEVAINWSDLEIHDNGDTIRTSMTKDALKALPQYKYEKPDQRHSAFADQNYHGQQKAQMAGRPDRAAAAVLVPAKGLRLSKLIGAEVINGQRETIGEVDDIVVADGRALLVLSVGEFLGMGGHHVAVELDQAKMFHPKNEPDSLEVTVQMTKEQLKGLPAYDVEAWNRKKM